jgi:hypothetical protein
LGLYSSCNILSDERMGLSLLVCASVVIFRSEFRGSHNHILLSQIRYSPNLEGQVPVFVYPRNRVAQLCPPDTGFPFRRVLRLAGLRWRYSTPPPHGILSLGAKPSRLSLSQSYYVTIDSQSASLSWNEAPIWGLRPDFYYCQTVAGLLMWALSLTRGRVSCLPHSVNSNESLVIM